MSSDSAATPEHPSQLLAYLKLFRIPNVFTAVADVLMGFLFVHGSLEPLPGLLCLIAASCLLYTAGMVLNDVYDYDVDAKQRPTRPLPAGQISLNRARLLGYGMLFAGIACGALAGYVGPTASAPAWRSGAVAVLLATCVIAYDAVFKKTILGPFAMGGCRFFNVLLGMSLNAVGGNTQLLFEPTYFIVAGGIGWYIVGVTWFARTEASETSGRGLLTAGVGFMALGVILLGLFPRYSTLAELQLSETRVLVWPLALVLLSFPILRRCLAAISHPVPQRVQAAVKHCIRSLIVLDAAVVMLVADWWSIAILALLIPSFVLGKWVYST